MLAKADYALLETGWGRIFDWSRVLAVPFLFPEHKNLRFTLDYDDDYAFFGALLEDPGYYSGLSGVDTAALALRKEYYKHNQQIALDYWVTFSKNIKKEEAGK